MHEAPTQFPRGITIEKGLLHRNQHPFARQIIPSNRNVLMVAMTRPTTTVGSGPTGGTPLRINQMKLTTITVRVVGQKALEHNLSIGPLFESFKTTNP